MNNILEILDNLSVSYSLQTLYVGMQMKLLDKVTLEIYVNHMFEKAVNHDPYIFIATHGYDIDSLIRCMQQFNISIPVEGSDEWNNATRILRYALLMQLMSDLHDNHEILLDKVADLYATFGYPNDMDHLIYYMPSNDDTYDPQKHDVKENRLRLIHLLQAFLNTEKQVITHY